MRIIFFIFLAFSLNAQTASISCPSSVTINTNSDGTSNYNCSTLVTAAMNLGAIVVNGGSCTLNNSYTGATTGTGGTGSIAGVTFNKGVSTVTYTLNGCSASPNTCSFNVTVVDNEAPARVVNTVISPSTAIVDTCSFYAVAQSLPKYTDNCPISNNSATCVATRDVVEDVTSCATKTPLQKYISKVTRYWLCTDEAGNTSTSTSLLYARDMKAPTAVVKAGFVIRGGTNVSYAASNFNNGSFDNCGGAVTLRACLGASCTSYVNSLTITSTYIAGLSSGQQATWPVNIEVKDICGNATVVPGTIVVQRL
jgi:hypothetical protein